MAGGSYARHTWFAGSIFEPEVESGANDLLAATAAVGAMNGGRVHVIEADLGSPDCDRAAVVDGAAELWAAKERSGSARPRRKT